MLKISSLLHSSKHLSLNTFSKLVRESSYAGLINLNKRPTLNSVNYLLTNNIHSSSRLNFIKNTTNDSNNSKTDTPTTSTPKINLTQTPKSILSDDLKSILNSISVEDTKDSSKTTSPIDENKQPDSNEKKGVFGAMFSRENSWKVTLVFFTGMFGFCFVYVITNWGISLKIYFLKKLFLFKF